MNASQATRAAEIPKGNSNALQKAMMKPVKLPDLPAQFRVTPVFRISFVHLDAPWGGENGKPAYQCLAVFSDDADLSSLRAEERRKLVEKFGPESPKMIQHGVYKMPIHPKVKMADRYAGFEGNGYYASLRSQPTQPPQCIDFTKGGKPILLQIGAIERAIYSGCYCYATFQSYNFDKGGGKGVSFGLRTLVKVADGDPLGGPPPASREEVLGSVSGLNLPGLIVSDGSPMLIEGKAIPPWEEPAGSPAVEPDEENETFEDSETFDTF